MEEVKVERKNLFEHLKERGFVYQMTDEEAIKKMCDGEPTAIYVGIDPTADSLHIGHFFSLLMLKKFQEAGHKVIVLLGGATALIGDPSGRTDMRQMINDDFIKSNFLNLKEMISRAIKLDGKNPAIVVNNADWIRGYDYVDFMRDIGSNFNVARMLQNESCARRMESGGLTFLEMGYMLIQAYDFVYLNRKYGCQLQVGGSDQWGNIVAGVELGRKLNFKEGKNPESFQALTCPLLTNAEGQKMGKTSKGALWISKEKTSVYDFYQYFINTDDRDTLKLLKLFTNYKLSDLQELVDRDIRAAKKLMAFEITKVVHGEEEALQAQKASEALFGAGTDLSAVPSFSINKSELNLTILDIAVNSKLIASKSEGRRLVEQGGILLNEKKVDNFDAKLTKADFADGYALLKKGKKAYMKIILE